MHVQAGVSQIVLARSPDGQLSVIPSAAYLSPPNRPGVVATLVLDRKVVQEGDSLKVTGGVVHGDQAGGNR